MQQQRVRAALQNACLTLLSPCRCVIMEEFGAIELSDQSTLEDFSSVVWRLNENVRVTEGGGAKVFARLWSVKVLAVVVAHGELCDCHCQSWSSRKLSVTPDIAPATLHGFSHWALTPTHALYDSTFQPPQVISKSMWNAWIGSNCC